MRNEVFFTVVSEGHLKDVRAKLAFVGDSGEVAHYILFADKENVALPIHQLQNRLNGIEGVRATVMVSENSGKIRAIISADLGEFQSGADLNFTIPLTGKIRQLAYAPAVTDEQMEELYRYVYRSPGTYLTTKKLIVWMLRRTDNLSKPVVLTIPAKHRQFGELAVADVHNMVSASHSSQTRLNEYFNEKLGLRFPQFSFYSRSNERDGWTGRIFVGEGQREELVFDEDAISAVDLSPYL